MVLSQNVGLTLSLLAICSVAGAGIAIGSGIALLSSGLTEEEVRSPYS